MGRGLGAARLGGQAPRAARILSGHESSWTTRPASAPRNHRTGSSTRTAVAHLPSSASGSEYTSRRKVVSTSTALSRRRRRRERCRSLGRRRRSPRPRRGRRRARGRTASRCVRRRSRCRRAAGRRRARTAAQPPPARPTAHRLAAHRPPVADERLSARWSQIRDELVGPRTEPAEHDRVEHTLVDRDRPTVTRDVDDRRQRHRGRASTTRLDDQTTGTEVHVDDLVARRATRTSRRARRSTASAQDAAPFLGPPAAPRRSGRRRHRDG